MTVNIRFVHAALEQKELWNQFASEKNGTFFHTWEWLSVFKKAGFDPYPIIAKEGEDWVGIIPLVILRKFGFKKAFSLPFSVAGILSDDYQSIFKVIQDGGFDDFADSLQMTSSQEPAIGYDVKALRHVTLPTSDEEQIIFNGFGKGLKSDIKKAQKSPIQWRRATDVDDVNKCWEIYCETMRRNSSGGTFWKELFLDIFHFPDHFKQILMAIHNDEIIAFNIFLRFEKHAHYFAAGSKAQFHKFAPNAILLWENILWSKKLGSEVAELGGGISDDGTDSLFDFKKKWGESCTVYRSLQALNFRGKILNWTESKINDSMRRKLKSLVIETTR